MSKFSFKKNITLWSSLGAAFEYYDFIIFAYLAPYLSQVFFSGTAHSALMKTYMAYAISYLARPLGSFLYGAMGDVKGRYKTFLTIMYTMSFSTLGIALLPSFDTWGLLSPLLLFLLRLLQGISFGAELPGAIIMVSEHAKHTARGLHCGFVISSVTLGSVLASLTGLLLTKVYDDQAIVAWAWRIPFFIGGSLALLNLWIRRQLSETPEFLKTPSHELHQSLWQPSRMVLNNQGKSLFASIGLGLISASLVTTNIYFPVLIPKFFPQSPSDVYLGLTIGLLWCAFVTPLLGKWGDHMGPQRLFVLTGLCFIALFGVSFKLLTLGFWGLVVFCCLFQTFIGGFVSSYFPLLVSTFKVQYRFTAVALSYNITYALVSLLPLLLGLLLTPGRLWGVLTVSALLSLAGHYYLSLKRKS